MGFHWFAAPLNRNIAPGFSEFTEAGIPTLEGEFPESKHWLINHFLSAVFQARYKDEVRMIVLGYIRRTSHAFELFHSARARTNEYLENADTTNPRIRLFYDILNVWEAFALQTAMAIDLLNAFSDERQVFEKGDGSPEQRLYDIANSIKHIRGAVEKGKIDSSDSVPLWLSNSGLHSFGLDVTFEECSEILGNLAKVAEEVQDPVRLQEAVNQL